MSDLQEFQSAERCRSAPTDRPAATICFKLTRHQGTVTLRPGHLLSSTARTSTSGGGVTLIGNGCTIILTETSTSAPIQIGNVNISGGAAQPDGAMTTGTYEGCCSTRTARARRPTIYNKINGNSYVDVRRRDLFPEASS